MRASPTVPAVSVALIAALSTAQAAAQDLLVTCKTLVVAPGTVLSPGELLVRDGKIAHLGSEIPAEARARAERVSFAGATIVPGFVLAHSTLGQEQDLAESAVAWTPELLAAEAFDPFQDELAALPRSAITSCALAPSSRNVAGGIAALVKPGRDMGRVTAPETYLKLSVTGAARNPERMPTSLLGAVDMLRQAFAEAKAGVRGGPDLAAIGTVLRQGRRVFVHADTVTEIGSVLELAREFGFEPVLIGARAADECLDRIAAARAAVVLDPLRPEMRTAQLALPGQLAARNLLFSFHGDPEQLRTSAALAIRHGASREAVLAAVTTTPAGLIGQGDRVGTLRRGADADFTVWSGHPLDLTSALRAVYVDGVRLFGDAPAATPATTPKETL